MKINIVKLGVTTIFLFLLPNFVMAQTELLKYFNSGKPIIQKEGNVVPFDLSGHRIIVKVKINDSEKKYNFILDTGALSMLDEKTAEELHLEKGTELPTIGEIKKTYLIKRDLVLQLGDVKIKDFIVPMCDLSNFQKSGFGPKIEGFIGSDFLRFFTVTIDYKQKRILFSPAADSLDAKEGEYKIKFQKHFPIRAPMAKCVIDGNINAIGMIDTGSPFAVVFPLSLVDKQTFSRERQLIKSKGIIVKWPISSDERNFLTRVKSFTMGGLEIRNIPVLCANSGDIMIGKDFLSQFIVTINYPANEMILKPYEKVHFKNNLFSAGVQLMKDKNKKTVVRGFWEGSPADKCGIQVDDEILEINSKSVKDLSYREIKSILHDDAIKSIELLIRNKEGEKRIVLKKEMLFPEI